MISDVHGRPGRWGGGAKGAICPGPRKHHRNKNNVISLMLYVGERLGPQLKILAGVPKIIWAALVMLHCATFLETCLAVVLTLDYPA